MEPGSNPTIIAPPLSQPYKPDSEGRASPYRHEREGRGQSWRFIAHQDSAHDRCIKKECDRSGDHRTSLDRGVFFSVSCDSQSEGRKRNRGRCAEQPGETLRSKNVSREGKSRHERTTNQESEDELFRHCAFFNSGSSPFPRRASCAPRRPVTSSSASF